MNKSSPHPKAQQRKAAQPNALMKPTEESPPMRLQEAMEYFSSHLPKAFRVSEGVYSRKGREEVSTGDIFIPFLKKEALFLKLKSGNNLMTIPVVTQAEFALTPLSEECNETDAAIRSWEGEFQSITELFEAKIPMPAALKVLKDAFDHGRQKVPAKSILFCIHPVSQRVGLRKRRGIEGVDLCGKVHRFLEGEDPLYFSTRLFDIKCSPMCFANVVRFPQTARVYLHPNTKVEEEEEEEVNLLPNLSTVTITEIFHGHHLVVRKLSDDGNHLGPTVTIPVNADMKVVAIQLKDSQLFDEISGQRCIVTASSSSDSTDCQADTNQNPYTNDPIEARRGDIQAGRKEDRDYYNEDTSRRKKFHQYVNVQVAVAFVPSSASNDCTVAGEQDYIMMGDTESVDDNDDYEYMDISAPVKPHTQKLPYPRNLAQQLAVPCMQLQNQKDSSVASLGHSPVAQARKADSLHSPSSVWKRRWQGSGVDAHPSDQQLFHHVARKLGGDWKPFALYLGCETIQIQQADQEQSLESKAFDILVTWRKGAGNKPKTWAIILKALKNTGLTELAQEIQRDIEGGTLYNSTSQVT